MKKISILLLLTILLLVSVFPTYAQPSMMNSQSIGPIIQKALNQQKIDIKLVDATFFKKNKNNEN